jgi:hypothetical protein
MLLEFLLFGTHLGEIATAHMLADKLRTAVQAAMPGRNHDLEAAVVAAFSKAAREQAKAAIERSRTENRALTDEETTFWRQLPLLDTLPGAVTDALLIGDKTDVQKAVNDFIATHLCSFHPDVQKSLQKSCDLLPSVFLFEFGEVLKAEEHRKAWTAYLHETGKCSLRAIRKIETETDEQKNVLAEIRHRLDNLINNPNVLLNFAEPLQKLSATMREGFENSDKSIKEEGRKTRKRFAKINHKAAKRHRQLREILRRRYSEGMPLFPPPLPPPLPQEVEEFLRVRSV